MAEIRYGERIGREGRPLLSCSTVVLDSDGRVLLTRRVDNGRWCLPGGHFDAGESVTEAAVRETLEETGLEVEIVRLIGVYSDPNRLLRFADGNQFHVVALSFEAKVVGGTLTTSDETSEFRWVSPQELSSLDLMEHHVERIRDAVNANGDVYVR